LTRAAHHRVRWVIAADRAVEIYDDWDRHWQRFVSAGAIAR
jgi:hypothetical protein